MDQEESVIRKLKSEENESKQQKRKEIECQDGAEDEPTKKPKVMNGEEKEEKKSEQNHWAFVIKTATEWFICVRIHTPMAISDLASYLGITYSTKDAYYQVGAKHESISVKKDLLLVSRHLIPTTYTSAQVNGISDRDTARKMLQMTKEESYSIDSTWLPTHLIFVQSSSPRRNLDSTTYAAFKTTEEKALEFRSTAKKTAEKICNVKRSKPVIQWPKLESALFGDLMEGAFIAGFRGDCLCDEKVDTELRDALMDRLNKEFDEKAFKPPEVKRLTQRGRKVVVEDLPEDQMNILGDDLQIRGDERLRISWVTEDKNQRINIYVQEEFDVIAVDLGDDAAVVVGTAGAHPFIRSQEIQYDNSDGSGPMITPINPHKEPIRNIFRIMMKYLKEFCDNKHH